MFADDTSLFSVAHDPKITSLSLNEDFLKINQLSYHWKMLFNPDTSQQAQERVFSRKKNITTCGTIFFNNFLIVKENVQKHLGLLLDTKLNFLIHINEKMKKVNKGISVIKKLNLSLPHSSLITIYKSFVRPHLD